jgi:hypothetical protein
METSIEWLLNELKRMQYFIGNDMLEAYKQTKEIHKQEIIKAAQWMPKPYDNIEFLPELAEQYYKETYDK